MRDDKGLAGLTPLRAVELDAQDVEAFLTHTGAAVLA
jgi:hypothetical protein